MLTVHTTNKASSVLGLCTLNNILPVSCVCMLCCAAVRCRLNVPGQRSFAPLDAQRWTNKSLIRIRRTRGGSEGRYSSKHTGVVVVVNAKRSTCVDFSLHTGTRTRITCMCLEVSVVELRRRRMTHIDRLRCYTADSKSASVTRALKTARGHTGVLKHTTIVNTGQNFAHTNPPTFHVCD